MKEQANNFVLTVNLEYVNVTLTVNVLKVNPASLDSWLTVLGTVATCRQTGPRCSAAAPPTLHDVVVVAAAVAGGGGCRWRGRRGRRTRRVRRRRRV